MQQQWANRDISVDAGQSDCESPFNLLSLHRSVFYRSVFLQSASRNSVSRYIDTRSTAVLFVIFVLVCDVSVFCTCIVLLHILSGSVWVCNLCSARLCNAHYWLKGCVVGQNRFHLHMSPIMSHAHPSSSSCLPMSAPLLSSYSSILLTLQTTLPIDKHCDDPQNEEYGLVADTTSSTCVRNKLQFRAAQQNQKSFPWMQV